MTDLSKMTLTQADAFVDGWEAHRSGWRTNEFLKTQAGKDRLKGWKARQKAARRKK